jgi:hypothetical protein
MRRNALRRHYFGLLFLGLLCSGCNYKSDLACVQEAFDGYKKAILANDGAGAVKWVSQSTLDQYQKYVDLAKHAKQEELKSLSLIDKLVVFRIKLRIPDDQWKDLTGKKVFVYAVEHDWIGKQGVRVTRIRDIDASGSEGSAQVVIREMKTPFRYRFVKEDDGWKFDLASSMDVLNQAFKSQLKQLGGGLTEEQLLFRMIESTRGKNYTKDVWEPRP